jgi:predicted dehydrogenase
MLARPHWSHELPGGRWFETLPHALYLIHTFAGPLAVTHVAARRTPSAPPGVPADEVAITFEGETCLANVHYSANCPANRRTFVLEGSEGCIDIDILSGAARLSRRRDTRWRRALGPGLTEPLAELARAVPERALTLADRLGGVTPHARLIAAFARHLHDDAPSPTPLAEVDYVVRQCDAIGRAIDRQAWGARAAG